MTLIAVRREVLEEEEDERRVEEAFRSTTKLSPPVIAADLGTLYFPPGKGARETLEALVGLLRGAREGERERRAARLVAADDLAVRLSEVQAEASEVELVRQRLAAYGIRYVQPGRNYDHSLLRRAWREFPETEWGQRAFLLLQQASCSIPDFGGLESFRGVIREGEQFLRDDPETAFRKEQLYFLAVANETEWSLSRAVPGDPTAEGSHVDEASAERARERAIALYEELNRMAPGSEEADAGRLVLPRLKLKLGTGQRTFFCYTD